MWVVIAIELVYLASTYLARRSPALRQFTARAVEGLPDRGAGVRILAFYASSESQIRA